MLKYLPEFCQSLASNKNLQMLTFIFLNEDSHFAFEKEEREEYKTCFNALLFLSSNLQKNTHVYTLNTPLVNALKRIQMGK